VRCSINSVIDGSEVWQCINVRRISQLSNQPIGANRPGDFNYHTCNELQSDAVQCPTCSKTLGVLPYTRETPGVTSSFLPLQLNGDMTHMGSLQDSTGVCTALCVCVCVFVWVGGWCVFLVFNAKIL